jgi:hypothetical protein
VASVGAAAGAATLGAKQADYGKNKGKTSVVAYDTLEAGALATSDKAGDAAEEHESSSNAGSSGWSSSAGVSSLNTGSNDDSVDPAADRGEGGAAGGIAAGSTLAAIGAASAIPRVVDKRCVIRECTRFYIHTGNDGYVSSRTFAYYVYESLCSTVKLGLFRVRLQLLVLTWIQRLKQATGRPLEPLQHYWRQLPILNPFHHAVKSLAPVTVEKVQRFLRLTLPEPPNSTTWSMLVIGKAWC